MLLMVLPVVVCRVGSRVLEVVADGGRIGRGRGIVTIASGDESHTPSTEPYPTDVFKWMSSIKPIGK